jgi:hypothetical protein
MAKLLEDFCLHRLHLEASKKLSMFFPKQALLLLGRSIVFAEALQALVRCHVNPRVYWMEVLLATDSDPFPCHHHFHAFFYDVLVVVGMQRICAVHVAQARMLLQSHQIFSYSASH